MLNYPYTYGDYLSEEEAMQRRVDLFDRVATKGLVLAIFWSVWSLIPTTVFAADLPVRLDLGETPKATPDPNPITFATIAEICKCASPQIKTAILLTGITCICYSALCSKDKPLIVAYSSLVTYVAIKLSK